MSAAADAAWHANAIPGVITQDVEFRNAGAVLHGTLYRPNTPGHFPAVVVLHGAEVSHASAPLYSHLREGLPAMGFAVLVFDRRGSGQSTGTLQNVSYETLADDGIAGARALAKLPFIDASHIGYWGLSQGGWLATFAAERDPKAAFAVSVSAPLVTPEQQMEFAMANRLHIGGYSSSDIALMMAARKAWTGYLRGTNSRDVAVGALAKIDKKPWFDLMYMPSSADLTRDPSTSAWRKQMDDDPLAALQHLKAPALFIFGGADPWIPVGGSIALLRNFAKSHANVQYAVIDGVGHTMKLHPHETMEVSKVALNADVPESPAYFLLLGSWLTRHVQ